MQRMLLEIQDLTKSFGGLMAVDAVTLKVDEGGCYSIIGPNGAGKSTLFNLISGYFPPDFGRVHFCGNDITALSIEARCRIGIARSFQLISIFPRLTAYDNVLISFLTREGKSRNPLRLAKRLFRQEVHEVLASVGLADQALFMAGELSLGDQKRLELGMVISQRPRLLLLDEPTAGMSPVERMATMELLQKLAEDQGLTVLLTEHDMSFVFSISKWIGVLNYGRLIAEGPSDAIKGNELVRKVYLGEKT
jgi:branched-chain amino acid transport system ATP-binding protein